MIACMSAASRRALATAGGASCASSPVDRVHRAGGLQLDLIGRMARIAEQLGALGAELGGVDAIARLSKSPPRLPRASEAAMMRLAQRAALQRGIGGLAGGVGQAQQVLAFLPAAFAALRRQAIGASLRPASSSRVSTRTAAALVSLRRFCLNGGRERGELGIHRLELRLVLVGELRAGANEIEMVAPEQAQRLRIQAERVASFHRVRRMRAEEGAVEVDRVAVGGEAGPACALRASASCGLRVRAGQDAEHRAPVAAAAPCALEGDDGVVEGRGRGIARDDCDFLRAFSSMPCSNAGAKCSSLIAANGGSW